MTENMCQTGRGDSMLGDAKPSDGSSSGRLI